MRRFLTVLIYLLSFLLLLSGCGSRNTTDTSTTREIIPNTDGKLYYKLNNVEIFAGVNMTQISKRLGEPDEYNESMDDDQDMMHKLYIYGSVQIETIAENKTDYINAINLLDDTAVTPEGISLGSTSNEVKEAFGDPDPDDSWDENYFYTRNETQLQFSFDKDSKVNAIWYFWEKYNSSAYSTQDSSETEEERYFLQN